MLYLFQCQTFKLALEKLERYKMKFKLRGQLEPNHKQEMVGFFIEASHERKSPNFR
jgi:hypothetical protein